MLHEVHNVHQMAHVTIKIEGIENIVRKWQSVPAVVKREFQGAIKKAVIVAEAKVKKEAPVDTGNLANRVKHTISPMRGVVFTTVKYAPFVEFGTKPHTIRPRQKKALAFEKGGSRGYNAKGRYIRKKGKMIVVRSVRHPGTKANPFFERSANEVRGKITDLFVDASFNILHSLE